MTQDVYDTNAMASDSKIANAAKRHAEARELERVYGRGFLERSLSEPGIRWRAITAPNAADYFD